MNIISTSGRDSDHIHATIDPDARRVLCAFAKAMTSLRRRLTSTRDKSLLEEIRFAARFCARLGGDRNGQMEILSADARRAFAITMRVCEVHRELIGNPQGLAVVLQLLACVTPVFIPRSSLPPAVELFDPERVHQEDRMAYEHVRRWRGPGEPQLPMLLAAKLWRVMNSQDSRSAIRLVESLERITSGFRETVASLHQSALIDADGRSEGGRS